MINTHVRGMYPRQPGLVCPVGDHCVHSAMVALVRRYVVLVYIPVELDASKHCIYTCSLKEPCTHCVGESAWLLHAAVSLAMKIAFFSLGTLISYSPSKEKLSYSGVITTCIVVYGPNKSGVTVVVCVTAKNFPTFVHV